MSALQLVNAPGLHAWPRRVFQCFIKFATVRRDGRAGQFQRGQQFQLELEEHDVRV
jgi:hypothetical protein